MLYSITQCGQNARQLCTVDEENKTVSTTECGLVFDFRDLDGWTFITSRHCTFITGHMCNFTTEEDCIFNTLSCCTFNTRNYCVFNVSSDCTFTTGDKCAIIRQDCFEVIQPEPNKTIKLNNVYVPGYTTVKPITRIVTLELTESQIESMRQQGINVD